MSTPASAPVPTTSSARGRPGSRRTSSTTTRPVERSPFLIIDLVSTFDVALFRRLPPALALESFSRALRYRRLLRTPEGAWQAWRDHQLLLSEARIIEQALEERLGIEPEHAFIASLGYARLRDGQLSTYVQPITSPEDEQGALAAFWHWMHRFLAEHYQLVTWGGSAWAVPFIVRRTVLLGMTPSVALPVGRRNLDLHFDLAEALANWDRSRTRPLELAAVQYGLEGPWQEPANVEAGDTAAGIRQALRDGHPQQARELGQARLRALWQLYERLARAYLPTAA